MDDHEVVVVDNGAGWIRAERATAEEPQRFPNAAAKSRAEAFTRYADFSQVHDITGLALRRPHERGYLSNADLEREIWSFVLRSRIKVDAKESGLLVTEPLVNLRACESALEQIVFEDFGFRSYYSCPAPVLAAREHFEASKSDASAAGTALVVDAGFSFTHAVPVFDGRGLNYGVRRLDFGGKAATNLLKEIVSHRSMNVMSEPYVVEMMKEETCFVSMDARSDLLKAQKSRGSFALDYVLPDGVTVLRPRVKTKEDEERLLEGFKNPRHAPQVATLNHERFMVPEVFFSPSDVGLHQCGIAELAIQACECVDPLLRPLMLSNVLLVGGSSLIPGLPERFRMELRKVAPIDCEVNVFHSKEMACEGAWRGGKRVVNSGEYRAKCMTIREYQEHGLDPTKRRFLS